MLLASILVLITLLLVFDYVLKQRRNAPFQRAGIKTPAAWPIIGNITQLAGHDTTSVFTMLDEWGQRFGKIYHMWFFYTHMVFVRDIRYIESILSSSEVITKNVLYEWLRVWLGDGLLISTGAKWHARRKIITPTFHFKILEQFVEVFEQQSDVMVQQLQQHADGKTVVNLFPVICLLTLDVITESAMGVKINAQMHPELAYAKALTAVGHIIATRFMKASQFWDISLYLTAPKSAQTLRKSIDIMHRFTDKVISERRAALEKSIADGSYQSLATSMNDMGIKQRMAFLDVLLQSTINGQPLSNADIREEVDTFMFEGHDTTASGISFTCYLLSRHPRVQSKVFQEIRNVIGDDKTQPVGMRELQELKYLECVIKEGLRLYPPVPLIGRITDQEVILNGATIPAKTNFGLLLYAVLRDADYFAQPDDFIPERFSAEQNEKIDPFAYVPFSAGPRNCIGQKFAMLEMKSTISKLLRHYELLPLGEPVRPMLNLIMRSTTGVNIGLQPRAYD